MGHRIDISVDDIAAGKHGNDYTPTSTICKRKSDEMTNEMRIPAATKFMRTMTKSDSVRSSGCSTTGNDILPLGTLAEEVKAVG